MENNDKDLDFLSSTERSGEDALSETAVFERLSEGSANAKRTEFTETSVFEKLTDEDSMSETAALKKMTGDESETEENSQEKSNPYKEVLLFFRDLAVCMAAVLIAVNFLIRPIQVKGSSMYPTLTDGSLGFSNILGNSLGHIERFDILIIYVEEKDEYLVKRCVGLPGETVAYHDETLYINGEPVEEDFFDESYRAGYDVFTDDFAEIALGDDEYYCLGDNRPHSSDSRYYGPFKKENIKSKGVFIIFPFTEFGGNTW